MKPNDINRLIQAANRIEASEKHPTPFFLISWTAWEALRSRTIRVVMKRQGWDIKHADQLLRKLRISGMSAAESVLVELGVGAPSQWPGLSGNVWRQLIRIEIMRHRLTHGFDSLHPKLIRVAGRMVIALLENRSWLERVQVVTQDGTATALGNVMGVQARSRATSISDVDSLLDRIKRRQRAAASSRSSVLPSELELKRVLASLACN